jgi:hypothetical protein
VFRSSTARAFQLGKPALKACAISPRDLRDPNQQERIMMEGNDPTTGPDGSTGGGFGPMNSNPTPGMVGYGWGGGGNGGGGNNVSGNYYANNGGYIGPMSNVNTGGGIFTNNPGDYGIPASAYATSDDQFNFVSFAGAGYLAYADPAAGVLPYFVYYDDVRGMLISPLSLAPNEIVYAEKHYLKVVPSYGGNTIIGIPADPQASDFPHFNGDPNGYIGGTVQTPGDLPMPNWNLPSPFNPAAPVRMPSLDLQNQALQSATDYPLFL